VSETGPESRRFNRAPVSVEVQYRTKGSFLVSYSLNLSKGGIFLETSDLCPIGTDLTVRFTIPGNERLIETQAKVMWVRRKTSDDGLPPGLGLQFDLLEKDIGKIIDNLVQDFAGVRLLAVANDPAALERLTRYLQSILTCEVIQTGTSEILATGFGERIDLTMLDLDSSGDSGQLLIQMANKNTTPPIPVIALSKSPVQQAMALKEGVATVLENPPAFEQLRECVLSVLGKPSRLS
jgi:uncharacterized protein (TIGR02266 family)